MASSSSCSTSLAKYPCPSEVNITEFVKVKLSDSNYSMWKPMMVRLIETQGLLGFIDGTVPMPPETIADPDDDLNSTNITEEVENPDYKAWKRSDELLQRWIVGTLEQDVLAELLSHLKTAQEMWKLLEDTLTNYIDPHNLIEEEEKDLSSYLPLYKAALIGDWTSAKIIFEKKPDAVRAKITQTSETVLMVAARSKQGKKFVKELVELMEPEDLAHRDMFGFTALHVAARLGNIETAKLLVNKNPNLPNLWNLPQYNWNQLPQRLFAKSLPLHEAVNRGQKEMVLYLLNVTKEDAVPNPFEGALCVGLVSNMIGSEFFDIALSLVRRNPMLAYVTDSCPLSGIALKDSVFRSGTRLNFWHRLIYTWVPLDLENFAHHSGGDIESLTQSLISVRQKLHEGIWKVFEIVAPQIMKNIRDKKIKHHQALQLVKHLCTEVVRLNYSEAFLVFAPSLKFAAKFGIREIVEEIFDSFPSAVYIKPESLQSVFHLAIKHRHENVFNLIYQFQEELRSDFLSTCDEKYNYCLHLAGFLENEQKLNLRSDAAGPALQMQRELQWFKEVEKFTIPQLKERKNDKMKTAATLFTESHQDLVKEGEKWMKDTANSCTIVAALIVTVVFAAAITVPGGNNGDSGLPVFSKRKGFIFFAVSDALALFSSTSSVLIFLSILTSRYGEYDFLYALPKRLIIGLVTLLISIISMMIAFGATLLLVFGDEKAWLITPVAALSCIPVGLFASLQFPLLLDMIKSTYGPGIFGKQSDRLLH